MEILALTATRWLPWEFHGKPQTLVHAYWAFSLQLCPTLVQTERTAHKVTFLNLKIKTRRFFTKTALFRLLLSRIFILNHKTFITMDLVGKNTDWNAKIGLTKNK